MTPPARKRPSQPPTTQVQEWFERNWPILTKVVIFVLGVAIVVNEVFVSPPPTPYALAAAGGLFGLPLTFKGESGNGNGKR